MTTPARKPPTRARAASPEKTPAAAGAATAPRRTSKTASSARSPQSGNGTMPGDGIPTTFRSVVIESVTPELDGGRYPVKREVGDTFVVEADLFKEGHDIIAGWILYRAPGDATWQTAPLTFFDNDRWRGSFELTEPGLYTYTVEAYPDRYRSWAADTKKKVDAGQDVAGDLLEGSRLLGQLAEIGADGERTTLRQAAETVGNVTALD